MSERYPRDLWCVAAADLDLWWPQVGPVLQKIVDRNPRYSLDGIRRQLEDTTYTLLVAGDEQHIELACILAITDYPAQRWLTIIMCAGKNLVQWIDKAKAWIDKFAFNQACAGIECGGREEWSRVFGMARAGVFMEKVI